MTTVTYSKHLLFGRANFGIRFFKGGLYYTTLVTAIYLLKKGIYYVTERVIVILSLKDTVFISRKILQSSMVWVILSAVACLFSKKVVAKCSFRGTIIILIEYLQPSSHPFFQRYCIFSMCLPYTVWYCFFFFFFFAAIVFYLGTVRTTIAVTSLLCVHFIRAVASFHFNQLYLTRFFFNHHLFLSVYYALV